MTLPGPRDEAWKYTPVRRFLEGVPEQTAQLVTTGADLPYGSPPQDTDRQAWGLADLAEREARVGALDRDRDVVHHVTGAGVATARDVWRVDRDGLVVEHLTGGAEALTLKETAFQVAAGCKVVHVRIADDHAPGARHAGLVTVQLGRDASYTLISILAGGELGRLDLAVRLREPGARADLHGLTVLAGTQHADHHVTVFHDAPLTTSRQAFRALVDGRARSVFTGKVVVRRGADGSDAGQVHRALLLGERAVANARPQLEIHTDDVKASHGTAIGSIDAEALFYLRQRGLDALQARALLVRAFAATVVDAAPESLRPRLDALLARWMSP